MWLVAACRIMAQELLTTFNDDLRQVTLNQARSASYKIFIDDQKIFDREDWKGFPEIKEIKQM
jgi:selenoprotein W-related protein